MYYRLTSLSWHRNVEEKRRNVNKSYKILIRWWENQTKRKLGLSCRNFPVDFLLSRWIKEMFIQINWNLDLLSVSSSDIPISEPPGGLKMTSVSPSSVLVYNLNDYFSKFWSSFPQLVTYDEFHLASFSSHFHPFQFSCVRVNKLLYFFMHQQNKIILLLLTVWKKSRIEKICITLFRFVFIFILKCVVHIQIFLTFIHK